MKKIRQKMLAVLDFKENCLDMLDITHLPNYGCDQVTEYLRTLYDDITELTWMVLDEPDSVWFHSPKDGWMKMPQQKK